MLANKDMELRCYSVIRRLKPLSGGQDFNDRIYISGSKHSTWFFLLFLKRSLAVLREFQCLPSHSISLMVELVESSEMKKINQAHRGKKEDTDVLSFENPSKFLGPGAPLGTLVLSTTRIREQSLFYSHSLEIERGLVVVHGLLHLLGFDHEISSKEYERMLQAEIRVLKRLQRVLPGVSSGLLDRAMKKESL